MTHQPRLAIIGLGRMGHAVRRLSAEWGWTVVAEIGQEDNEEGRGITRESLRGALVGFGLALLTILALLYSSHRMELAGTVDLHLSALDWILLACVPLVSVLLVTAIARMAALRGLAKMT